MAVVVHRNPHPHQVNGGRKHLQMSKSPATLPLRPCHILLTLRYSVHAMDLAHLLLLAHLPLASYVHLHREEGMNHSR